MTKSEDKQNNWPRPGELNVAHCGAYGRLLGQESHLEEVDPRREVGMGRTGGSRMRAGPSVRPPQD